MLIKNWVLKLCAALVLGSFSGCMANIAMNQNYDVRKIEKIAVLGIAGLENQPGIGQTVANELNFAFLQYGFNVVERSYINRLLAEQKLGVSGVIAADNIKKIGQMLGTEVIVVGSVERFKPENSPDVYFAATTLSSQDTEFFRIRESAVTSQRTTSIKYEKASLTLNFRLIDVETGAIVAVGSDTLESKTGVIAAKKLCLKLVKELKSSVEAMKKKYAVPVPSLPKP